MLDKYKPTWMVEAIYQITPEQLRAHGFKAVLTDLDNTLIAWNNPNGTEELINWLKMMDEAGIPVVVVSNNKASRVAKALEKFELDFVSRAMKPFAVGIKHAQEQLGLSKDEIVMIGDQVMTDIRGASAAGIRSILVQPIIDTDGWNTRINRFFERRVMRILSRKDPEMEWKSGL
ncbi:YqeG family HAD IIIA-type phosphatase [Enterococcus pseudoavium]|uniref:YqeG family HAD IIIA-type phosphatase n=1 Tax=Enterococcus pseudoavium TaxID=44007 RepID=A0AAE4I2C5_9ENTE|nr:YqeG family HAD IIIA-type phosphatase [Enterococcus pseudoavium]MDT2737182.1 YqeG family HAD IIIA-type phosphatase [Enterococcus pseudoavium]MDT2755301.1 YqeG family HAD IIIA-type phosphatase [Enterococcus pseudoavium]MDT2769749.1 YqeG family HAD IIIA-type phosphatase [Enterococcus pseudoavium]REC32041.1 HAD family hydrolase [Enterococcus pseudoavium]